MLTPGNIHGRDNFKYLVATKHVLCCVQCLRRADINMWKTRLSILSHLVLYPDLSTSTSNYRTKEVKYKVH